MPFPTITTTQQFPISIAPADRVGNPAPVEPGSVTWASSNEAVAQVIPDDTDELSALVVAQGTGSYEISVLADADLGEGVATISASDIGEVAQGTAVAIGFVVGSVEEQP